MDINTYTREIMAQAESKCTTARHDYVKGEQDCKAGIYDKWFRYHRDDDGRAYDMGWMEQNQISQVEKIIFLNA